MASCCSSSVSKGRHAYPNCPSVLQAHSVLGERPTTALRPAGKPPAALTRKHLQRLGAFGGAAFPVDDSENEMSICSGSSAPAHSGVGAFNPKARWPGAKAKPAGDAELTPSAKRRQLVSDLTSSH